MGYDLWVNDVTVDADGKKTERQILSGMYISYNHSIFSEIWHVRNNWHERCVKDVMQDLNSAIKQIEEKQPDVPVINTVDATRVRTADKFKATIDVFYSILVDLRDILLESKVPDNAICYADV